MFDIIPYTKEEYKEILTNSKGEFPTTFLQLVSLNIFMHKLEYEPYLWEHGHLGEKGYTYVGDNKHFPCQLTLEKAVLLHNYGFFYKRHDEKYEVPLANTYYLATNVHILKDANAARYLEAIYLVYNKKRKEFFVQENKVKFTGD